MQMPRNVRMIPRWVEKIPLLNKIGGSAAYPYILLKREFYEDLLSKIPKPKSRYVLIHEQTHIQRAKEMGPILWMLKYGIVPSFRVNEELAADLPAMRYWKSKKLTYDIDRRAKFLSGSLYFWPISFEDAKRRLTRQWNKI